MKTNRIGYGRPPRAHQFKKGQSGNPKGRPKKQAPEVGDIIADVINAPAFYTEGNRRKVATRDELSFRALINQAITGDVRAAEEIAKLLQQSENGDDAGPSNITVIGLLPD
jgi:hypothetical protein